MDYFSTGERENFSNKIKNAAFQKLLVENAHKHGKLVMCAVFGEWEADAVDPFGSCGDPIGLARQIANFVKVNYFDGVDVDYELNRSLNEGKRAGLEWLRAFS